jgi:hypothetical protein
LKRFLRAGAIAAFVFAMAGRAALAHTFEGHVWLQNKSDAYVWVTAYTGDHMEMAPTRWVPIPGKAVGAWCVAPGAFDKHGLRAHLYEVRVEVSAHGCQRNPVLLNQMRGFPYDIPPNLPDPRSHVSLTMTYYVHGKNGQYVFNNTP